MELMLQCGGSSWAGRHISDGTAALISGGCFLYGNSRWRTVQAFWALQKLEKVVLLNFGFHC